MKRTENPMIRVVGCKLYGSQNGKTCHQCRQKTTYVSTLCKNLSGKRCVIKFCDKCLLNRYGEKAEEVAQLGYWKCPRCRGICNCSFCMKKRGQKATGMLVQVAKKTGYASVSEMLLAKGLDNIQHNKIERDMGTLPKKLLDSKESQHSSPMKQWKKNSSDENIEPDLDLPTVTQISSKKSKETRRQELEEISKDKVDADALQFVEFCAAVREFAAMAVFSRPASKNKADRKVKLAKNEGGDSMKGRLNNSQIGRTCHQCRQKTTVFSASCKNLNQEKQCTFKFCYKCLFNRYGENAKEAALLDDWKCPKCRGICNCSFCMKGRGQRPIGALVQKPKVTGVSFVSQMLQLQVQEPSNVGHDEIVGEFVTSSKELISSKKKFITASPGKENQLDEIWDISFNSRNVTHICNEEESRKRKTEVLNEILNGDMNNDDALIKRNPMAFEEISAEDTTRRMENRNEGYNIDSFSHMKRNKIYYSPAENGGAAVYVKHSDEEHESKFFDGFNESPKVIIPTNRNNDSSEVDIYINVESRVNNVSDIEAHKLIKPATAVQDKEFNLDIQLPQFTGSVKDETIESQPEDVGNALQFLEFCASFGKALQLCNQTTGL